MAGVINILDPDTRAIGGGVGNIDLLYIQGLKEGKNHVLYSKLDIIFYKPLLGDSAVIIDAAFLN